MAVSTEDKKALTLRSRFWIGWVSAFVTCLYALSVHWGRVYQNMKDQGRMAAQLGALEVRSEVEANTLEAGLVGRSLVTDTAFDAQALFVSNRTKSSVPEGTVFLDGFYALEAPEGLTYSLAKEHEIMSRLIGEDLPKPLRNYVFTSSRHAWQGEEVGTYKGDGGTEYSLFPGIYLAKTSRAELVEVACRAIAMASMPSYIGDQESLRPIYRSDAEFMKAVKLEMASRLFLEAAVEERERGGTLDDLHALLRKQPRRFRDAANEWLEDIESEDEQTELLFLLLSGNIDLVEREYNKYFETSEDLADSRERIDALLSADLPGQMFFMRALNAISIAVQEQTPYEILEYRNRENLGYSRSRTTYHDAKLNSGDFGTVYLLEELILFEDYETVWFLQLRLPSMTPLKSVEAESQFADFLGKLRILTGTPGKS